MNLPIRMCIGCMVRKPKNTLIRIVRTPKGTVEIDLSGNADGRGIYICGSKQCFDKAVKKKSFSRRLKTEVSDEILNTLNENLE